MQQAVMELLGSQLAKLTIQLRADRSQTLEGSCI